MINTVHSLAMNSVTCSKELSRDGREGQGMEEEPGWRVASISPG